MVCRPGPVEGRVESFLSGRATAGSVHPIISLCSFTVAPDIPFTPNRSMRYTAQLQNPQLKLLLEERKWLVIEFINFPVIITSKIPRWAINPRRMRKGENSMGTGNLLGTFASLLKPLPQPLCHLLYAVALLSHLGSILNTQYSLNDEIQQSATLWPRSKWWASSFIEGCGCTQVYWLHLS